MSKKISKKSNEKKTKTAVAAVKAERAKAIKAVATTKKGKATSAAPVDGKAVTSGAVSAPAPRAPNPRLPPVGTLIEKKDRDGNVRCACTVEADGIRYAGTTYKSLSAAAMAAAKDLGLLNKTQNGYVFWGLEKVERHDPKEAAERASERYHGHITSMVTGMTDETKREVTTLVGLHTQALERLQDQLAG